MWFGFERMRLSKSSSALSIISEILRSGAEKPSYMLHLMKAAKCLFVIGVSKSPPGPCYIEQFCDDISTVGFE